jgi:hypothetical protein
MTARWRCSYSEGMFADEEPEWRLAAGIAVENGATKSVCAHESGHALTRFAQGFNCGPTLVQIRFQRDRETGGH